MGGSTVSVYRIVQEALPASSLAPFELDVRLDVVDALGRVVAVLSEGTVPAGAHRAEVDVRGWAPGTYVYRLRLDRRMVGTGRLVVAR